MCPFFCAICFFPDVVNIRLRTLQARSVPLLEKIRSSTRYAEKYAIAREEDKEMLMKTRKLGRSDLEVPPLAFGGNVFGWTVDEPTSMRLLDRLVAEGFNFIDT